MDVGTSPERLGYTTDAAGEIDVARDAVYARQSELQSNLKWLRENDPLRWTRPDGYRPFWFVSKHADVFEVARHPEVFLSGPRNQLLPIEIEERIRAIRERQRDAGADDGPHGRAGPQAVSRNDAGMVLAGEPAAARRAAARGARTHLRRSDGSQRRGVRLRRRRRGLVPASRHHVDPRRTGSGRSVHVAPHAGALRVPGSDVSRAGQRRSDRPHAAILRVLRSARRRASPGTARRSGDRHRAGPGQRRSHPNLRSDQLLRPHRHRRPRHDQLLDRRRPTGIARESRINSRACNATGRCYPRRWTRWSAGRVRRVISCAPRTRTTCCVGRRYAQARISF